MSFSVASAFHIETPAPGGLLAPGRHILTGWVWPQPGRHIVDVRARLDGRAFPGVHGWPRPDLAAHFQTGGRPALAGFSIPIQLPPGTVEVTLEALEIEGCWSPFTTVAYHAGGEPGEPLPPTPPKPLHPHDFARGLDFILRSRQQRPGESWARLAVELAASLPVNQDVLHPARPFIGHVDEPAVANSSRFGLLPVVGYLFHTSEKIQKLWITAELQTLQPLTLGRATANITPHFPDFPNAAVAGYEGFVDVPPQLPNPIVLRFYAEIPGQPLQLVQALTTRRHDADLEKHPCHGSASEFDEALDAWLYALRVRGFSLVASDDYRPALTALRADYLRPSLSAPRPVDSRLTPSLQHVLLATHNLNLEGAPLFLLDLARGLAASGVQLTVVSPAEGELRKRFVALGVKIIIIDTGSVFRADSEESARAALAGVGQQVDCTAYDLLISNTFTTFWAVHAAKASRTPVLWYVHESTSPTAFYRRDVHPSVVALVDEAFLLADAVSFTSAATRRYHAWPGRAVKAVLTPGWVDVTRVDNWLAHHPRDGLRASFGLSSGELLVTYVGTICDRKAQLGFARAVALFNARYPDLAHRTRFVLLGGRQAWFDRYLAEVLASLALPNLVVHPETPDFLGYYAAADLTVCASLEESSPRVVLEAMACGTPLLASDIPGISELARDGLEATLVPAGHTTLWAEALARVLGDLPAAHERARRARARLESHFADRVVLPAHLNLARAIAAGQPLP